MTRIIQILCLVFTALAFIACHKDKKADSPDSVEDYRDERDGTNYEVTQDPEEALEEAREERERAADEVDDAASGEPY